MFDLFISYLRNLAVQHHLIRFAEDHESFYRFDFDELQEKLRNVSCFPAVVLEGYSIGYRDNKAEQIFKPINTALIFVGKPDDFNNSDQVQEMYDILEQIADDFFLRMSDDKKKKTIKAISNFSLDSVEGGRISDSGNGLVMYRYSFEITSRLSNDVDKAKWMDL